MKCLTISAFAFALALLGQVPAGVLGGVTSYSYTSTGTGVGGVGGTVSQPTSSFVSTSTSGMNIGNTGGNFVGTTSGGSSGIVYQGSGNIVTNVNGVIEDVLAGVGLNDNVQMLSIQDANNNYVGHIPVTAVSSLQQLIQQLGGKFTMTSTGSGAVAVSDKDGNVVRQLTDQPTINFVKQLGDKVTYTVNKLAKIIDSLGNKITVIVDAANNVIDKVHGNVIHVADYLGSKVAIIGDRLGVITNNLSTLLGGVVNLSNNLVQSTTITGVELVGNAGNVVGNVVNNVVGLGNIGITVGGKVMSVVDAYGKYIAHVPVAVNSDIDRLFNKLNGKFVMKVTAPGVTTIGDSNGNVILQKNDPALANFVQQQGGFVTFYCNKLGKLTDNIGNTIISILDAAGNIVDSIPESAIQFVSYLGKKLAVIGNNVGNVVNNFGGLLNGVGQLAGSLIGAAGNIGLNLFGTAVNVIGNTAGTIVNTIGNTGNTIVNTITTTGNTIGNTIGNTVTTTGNTIGNTIGNTVTTTGNTIGNTVTTTGNTIGNTVGNTITNVINLTLGDKFLSVQDSTGKYVGHIPASVNPNIDALLTKLGGIVTMTVSGPGSLNIIDKTGNIVGQATNSDLFNLVNQLGGKATFSCSILQQIKDNFGNTLVAFADAVGNIVDKLPQSAVQLVNYLGGKVPVLGNDVSILANNLGGVLGGIVQLANNIVTSVINIGTNVINGATNVIGNILNNVGLKVGETILSFEDSTGKFAGHIPATSLPELENVIDQLAGKVTLIVTSPGTVSVVDKDGKTVCQLNDKPLSDFVTQLGGKGFVSKNKLGTTTDNLGNTVVSILNTAGQIIDRIPASAIHLFNNFGKNIPIIGNTLYNFANNIVGLFNGIGQFAGKVLGTFINTGANVINTAANIVGNVINLGNNVALNVGQKVLSIQDPTGKFVGHLPATAVPDLANLVNKFAGTVTLKVTAPGTVSVTDKDGKNVGQTTDKSVVDFVNQLGGDIYITQNTLGTTTDNSGNKIVSILNAAGQIIDSIPASAIHVAKQLGQNIPIIGNTLFNLVGTLGGLLNGIGQLAGGIVGTVIGTGVNIITNAGNAIGSVVGSITGLSNIGVKGGDNILTVKDSTGKFVGHLSVNAFPDIEKLAIKLGGNIGLTVSAPGVVTVTDSTGKVADQKPNQALADFVNKLGGSCIMTVNKLGGVTTSNGKKVISVVDASGNVIDTVPESSINVSNVSGNNVAILGDVSGLLVNSLGSLLNGIGQLAGSLLGTVANVIGGAGQVVGNLVGGLLGGGSSSGGLLGGLLGGSSSGSTSGNGLLGGLLSGGSGSGSTTTTTTTTGSNGLLSFLG